MQSTPEIKTGDIVRVMQTDEMCKYGLANIVYRVDNIVAAANGLTAIVGRSLKTGERIAVASHSVMKVDLRVVK